MGIVWPKRIGLRIRHKIVIAMVAAALLPLLIAIWVALSVVIRWTMSKEELASNGMNSHIAVTLSASKVLR